MNDAMPDEILERIRQALFRGAKIEAIKIYRENIPSHLVDAKTAVEQLEQQLHANEPEKFSAPAGGKGCGVTAAVFVLAGIISVGIGVFACV